MAGEIGPEGVARLRQEAANARTGGARLRALHALVVAAPGDARAHYEYARALARTRRHDAQALEQFRLALTADAGLAGARLGMGIIHHRRGDLDLAESMYRTALALRPRLLKAHLNLALLAEKRRDFEAVVTHYSDAVRLAPRSVEARYGKASALNALGKYREAVSEWEGALALDPGHGPSLGSLAKALVRAGDPRAGEFYARAVATRPDSVRLRREYSRWLAGNGRRAEAEAVLREGLRADPGSLRLQRALAEALADMGRPEEAIAALREGLEEAGGSESRLALARFLCSLGRYDEASAELRPLIMEDPRNAEVRRLVAVALACAGRPEEAVASARVALHVQPAVSWPRVLLTKTPTPPDRPLAELLAEGALVLPTHRAHALALRGILQLALGEPGPAAKLLDQAVQAAPESPLPRVGRGAFYLAQEQKEPAYAELRTAAILLPDDYHVQHLVGEAAFHSGRYEEASRAFYQATSLGEGEEASLRAYTFFCRARAFRKIGRTQEAILCYLETQRLDPDYPAGHYGCGVALQEIGKIEEALRHYQRCVAVAPKHARGLMGMATCLEWLGRAPEAVAAYRAAVEADPEYGPPRYNLAVLLERTGDPVEIAALLRGYLRHSPDPSKAADARRRLTVAELRATGVTVGSARGLGEAEESTPFLEGSQEGEPPSPFAPPSP